ncbi:uncharacterized protein PFL1_05263 [Pseudozyma flocculosa PF-1]|uniref:Uncharacterized protein n=2 Tax=Pseudozyma flocculosa TaxID=84751 RepID=A0A5C3F5F0_9BASI|nr:uncharacterized protein PFL1_05263 [Pseudozyma flocculosa PF-1]EPQ27341.1 hypothetical protein PFL1_05263 [Pseudozyma flocculosa PF-1]SPO39718.1 uncharacterized protein PSFLO_05199 [Pseudozyma flocculosa]
MVNPFVIAAAASAGVGAAVAFEFGVFRPWREDNWPHGIRQGIKVELEKLRRELQEGVDEIRDDIRDGIRGRRSPRRGNSDRLSDAELDEFRHSPRGHRSQYRDGSAITHAEEEQMTRGLVGRGRRSSSSETLRSEFEMHERQSSAYRAHLAASMGYAKSTGVDDQHQTALRRRNAPNGALVSTANSSEEARSAGPATATDLLASPELPHHALGDASPTMTDTASLARTAGDDEADDDDDRNSIRGSGSGDRTPLSASSPRTAYSILSAAPRPPLVADPFGDPEGVGDMAVSSWQAVFDLGGRSQQPDSTSDAEAGQDAWGNASRSNILSSHSFTEACAASHGPARSLIDLDHDEDDGSARPISPAMSQGTRAGTSPTVGDDDFIGVEDSDTAESAPSGMERSSVDADDGRLEYRSLSLYLDAQQSGELTNAAAAAASGAASPALTATSGVVSVAGRSDLLSDGETWLPLEASPAGVGATARLAADSDDESWAELGQSDSD